jgi:adenylate cyclase
MDRYLCRPLDIVVVKGREQGVRIYELIAKLSDDPDFSATPEEREWCQITQYAFQAYLNQNWEDAIKMYTEVLEKKSGDPVAKIYLERCTHFKKSPPPRQWDGVFHLKTK